jgi:prevent-host-death family protein
MNHKIYSVTIGKKNLDQIMHEVETGITVVITRYGKPVATLMPYDPKAITA